MIVLLAFTGFASAQTTISLFYGGMPAPASDALDALVEEFNRQNPDIVVEASRQSGYTATLEKATVSYAGGAAPNLILLEQMHSFGLILRGMVEPLDAYIAADPDFGLDDWYPPFLQTTTHEGSLYGLPLNTSTPLAYINAGLFAESGLEPKAPATWEEFASVSRRITRDTDGDGEPNIWGTDQTANWGWLFDAWIGQNGARMTNANGTQFTFNSNEAVEAMEFLQDLRHNARVIRYPGVPRAEWVAGTVGMIHRSTADLFGRMEEARSGGLDMDVGFLPCNTECFVPIGGGNLFMMNTGTQAEKDATWRLLRFLTSTESLATFSAKSGYMSARRSTALTEEMQAHFYDNPEFMVTYEQLERAQPRPQVPDWTPINRMIQAFTAVQFREHGNVREELNDIVRYGNQLLDEFYTEYNASRNR